MKPENCVAIVLAAGASSRFGSTKQLARYQGRPIISHILANLRDAGFGSIVVVTGANHEEIAPLLTNDIEVVYNKEWVAGMGHSIVCGINTAISLPKKYDGALIVLSDQPGISTSHFSALVNEVNGDSITAGATDYGDVPGAPAAFSDVLFTQLLALSGERGAQKLLADPGVKVKLVATTALLDDIDTQAQYKKFLERNDWRTN